MPDKENTSSIESHSFNEGMVKDMNASFSKKGTWSHARNLVNNSHDGEVGIVGSEPANKFAINVTYPILEITPLYNDKWVIFSGNNIDSEIGIFDESENSYITKVNQTCLNFKQDNKINAVTKKNFDCTYSVYWTDTGNPDRILNLDKPPYIKQKGTGIINDCDIKYTNQVDCEQLRISRIIIVPELKLSKGVSSGSLLNGQYQAVIAYTINGIRVTDRFSPSNFQSVFDHKNTSGSLVLHVDNLDTNFDEFELVVISNINQQTQAKKFGVYSTRQKTVVISYIDQTLETIPLADIVLQTPAYDKSDTMVEVNDYLLRIGVRTRPDFNYQPQANEIIPKWVAVELPADYYYKGGNLTSYPRDEQQAFFIRWIDNSGKNSADYPLIGRSSESTDISNLSGDDVYEHELDNPQVVYKWQVENTASVTSIQQYNLEEGRVIAEGKMGYWESTELYPQKPSVWGKLCGKPIRHPKFPDNELVPHVTDNGNKIVILAVKFENVTHPLDLDGNPIPGIIGYQIMKASREGHKTIIAKGILNNVGEYDIPGGITDKKGLYPNYPYNDLRKDPFLSKGIVRGGCEGKGYQAMGTFKQDVFTFHSPETQFSNPYLSSSELKIYGEISGTVTGGFEKVYKHPRHKLIRDFALIVSGLVGVGEGLLAIKGKKTTTYRGPQAINIGNVGVTSTLPLGGAVVSGFYGGTAVTDELVDNIAALDPTGLTDKVKLKAELIAGSLLGEIPGTIGSAQDTSIENTAISGLPTVLKILGGTILFSYYFSQGTEQTLRIIKSLVSYQEYALQYNSHGFYNSFKGSKSGNKRRKINNIEYLQPQLQEFGDKFRVNNLFRDRQVILEVSKKLDNPTIIDDSRKTVGDLHAWKDPFRKFTTTTSAFYAALKIPMDNQFGQIDSMIILPTGSQIDKTIADKTMKFTSSVIFGGDIYINRYTEKNSFFYFNDWLYDQLDGAEWNYNQHYNIPNPRYWINSNEYDVSQLTSALVKLNFKEDVLPNDLAHLDRDYHDCKSKVSFVIKDGYFYLFSNGVRDFFVESEINSAQRDYDELDSQRHYDFKNYTDLTSLFRSNIIKSGNHFKYDFSLSINKLLINTVSRGSVLPRDYDPFNQNCFTYYDKRVIYSLQQQEELKKDNWLAFLANNYKDFPSKITTIKSVNKTGALILFENDSPLLFQGVDFLRTDGGTKITIGDGGLFQQPAQQTTNADRAYQYGSCQNVRAIENTPAGLFWISADQGKIFSYGSGMLDMTAGLKWWFSTYLPFFLIKDFPLFELLDNSITGISCQTIYDNTNEILYICKKDYELKPFYRDKLVYQGSNDFRFGKIPIKLGDPTYFNDASFTVSYDVKQKYWVSYHDWHPDFLIPSKTHFLSVKGNSIWKHNQRCDLFCNFYGIDYPFEIEYNQPTGQDITTLRSIEYQLECFKYYNDCRDSHNILDENFDRLMVYNIEQISGLIKLLPKPKNSPVANIRAAQVDIESLSMYYAKEENKYRVNGITDLTRDRGEFSGVERQIWITEPNGYIKAINPININYNKSILQRKKIRHYNNKIFLRKNICGSSKFLLKVVNSKLLKSTR